MRAVVTIKTERIPTKRIYQQDTDAEVFPLI
jgi:hypothetical protein